MSSTLLVLYVLMCLIVCISFALPNLNKIISYKYNPKTKDTEYFKKQKEQEDFKKNNNQVKYEGYMPVDQVMDKKKETEEAIASGSLKSKIRDAAHATVKDIPVLVSVNGLKQRTSNKKVHGLVATDRDPNAFDFDISELSD
ncbi:hypothetical protein BABINDRAFT_165020 [Babjeviella inositovora NRRL Y-12698]|uniref:Uncharacterized protein n=1 Tax=Babjeviella inositovora NRRL Y-12698 TaxID=984486 RepID=A0A1E3QUW6_9ASCO|nr:uncharacterized protein BABINDRAFT_165020 [Babjeviella inositovora NRRL Y-12698]ODQ81469.1 hypothetical protein BABINDRAFT_165020 [Babjeviella inositovora NRRL Y-12698]